VTARAGDIAAALLKRGLHGIRVTLKGLRPDPAYVKRAFLLGFPASIEMSARALGLVVRSLLVPGFGTNILAAYGVGSNILKVVSIPAMGLSSAASALVGQNIGAGRIDRAEKTTILAAIVGFAALSLVGLLAWIEAPARHRRQVAGAVADDTEQGPDRRLAIGNRVQVAHERSMQPGASDANAGECAPADDTMGQRWSIRSA
jgi:hypothetical protein